MDLQVILLLIASLLIVVGLVQPLAVRFAVSATVLLALVGVAIGVVSTVLTRSEAFSQAAAAAGVIVNLPIHSDAFLYIFLPLLLFEAALNIEVRRMIDDAAPILLLAVVAVLVATAVIGGALGAVATVPAAACFMLGSIVATTDPVAVIGIFRDVGAPSRLIRLVEGESLLNDAAAITLFVLLLNIITGKHQPDLVEASLGFAWSFLGGIAVGYAGARLILWLMRALLDMRLAQITLTLALPYLVYIISEQLHVSGVVAAVSAGLAMNAVGQRRIAPNDWHFLHDVWEQMAFWASSLIFILASLLVPRMLAHVGWFDVALLLVLSTSALAARALVVFGVMPLFSAMQLSQSLDYRFKTVLVWGGLRGAVTLALALAVTEDPTVAAEVRRFIGVQATGFVLLTLLVNGTTLRLLIRLLRLDLLSPLDQAIRDQILALSRQRVSDAVNALAREYKIPSELVSQVVAARNMPDSSRLDEQSSMRGFDDYRLILGLMALANHERELLLDHFSDRTLSGPIVEETLAAVGRLIDRTRTGGHREYLETIQKTVEFSRPFRVAHFLHRWFSIDRLLVDRLADRFELLLGNRIVLEELEPFVNRKLAQLVGPEVTRDLLKILHQRREMTTTALDALRQQYPEYAELLERRILEKAWLRREEMEYRGAFEEGVIGPELYAALRREVSLARAEIEVRPMLDLGLETRALISKVDMFSSLDREQLDSVARLLRPRFAVPGESLIRDGDVADSMYFLSSGAVEVHVAGSRKRLTVGDFFGEMALVSGKRRQGDVCAIGYCQLLELKEQDFKKLLQARPELREKISSVAEARRRENEEALGNPSP